MRVYMSGRPPMGEKELLESFGDVGVEPGVLCDFVSGGESLLLRLAALCRCDAIFLDADWQQDERARLEKAFADYRHIPQISYCRNGQRKESS